MSVAQLTNLPASVKQRLLNISRQTQVEFNVLLTKYALERFLYRMSVSRSRLHFILKGALLFGVWSKELHRTTRDADFLSLQPPSLERLASDFRKICEVQAEPDGIRFLPGSVQAQEVRRQNIFGGIRITLRGVLGKANVHLQIDVGFGDACIPPAKIVSYPVLLDFPAPRLRAYARETMIAEKFHAAVDLGMRNSRMKDYFDIFYLSQKFDFKGEDLSDALVATFERQRTPIPRRTPSGLSIDFAMDPMKRAQWNHFLIQTNAMSLEKDFAEVVESVRKFLMPAARAAARGESFDKLWSPGGPWRPQEIDNDG
ncbi:MAG: nucleotidyl transferase AbiEii/AbiGii toxin family protein [Candidatus Aminicenantes bacterium]|nr:nucleotidyl transferase AbiEii/AbiGii toxin family protein [Candidatus Aminicenantes bacterium]